MTIPRFLYKSLWRNGTLLSVTSEHPQFPMENTQDDIKTLAWRSRYGSGTGNGNFVATASNNKIDFVEDSGTVVTDGGLEAWTSATNLTNWSEGLAGTSTVNQESTTKHGGSYACRMDIDASNSLASIAKSITMTAGASYHITLWYRTDAGKGAGLTLCDSTNTVFLKADGTWNTGTNTIELPPTSGVWTRYTLSFSAHASYTNYTLVLKRSTVVSAASSSLYFDDVKVCPLLTATITAGTYNGQTLATEIKTRMDAAGTTFTVTYAESTGKFTIAQASAAAFDMLWGSGPNTANAADVTLGFADGVDLYGAATYTSATIVCHTSEYLDCDFGAAYEYDTVALLNHNLTSAAVITVYGADDSAFTTNVVSDVVAYNANNVIKFLSSARTKRYCRIHIVDVANPNCYVQVGVAAVGKYFAPNRCFLQGYSVGEADETEMEKSPSNNLFCTQERPALVNWSLPFSGLDDSSYTSIRLMLAEIGVKNAMLMCTDSGTPNSYSYWLRFLELEQPVYDQYSSWSWNATLEEVL